MTPLKKLVSFTLLVSALSVSAIDKPQIFNPGNQNLIVYAISDNGRFAISKTTGDSDTDEPLPAGGSLIDLDSNTVVPITSTSGWADVTDVTDDGIVFGEANGAPGYWSPDTRQWTTFKVPSRYAGGAFTAVTPDGKTAVGYFRDPENPYSVYPMCFDVLSGQQKLIFNLPVVDLSGEDQHQNIFYGISPDGRYILGQMSQSYWLPVSLFSYVYDLETATWDPIGYDYNDATKVYTPQYEHLFFVASQFMNCSGTWVTGRAYLVDGGSDMDGGREYFASYRYNVATKEFEVYNGDGDRDFAGNKITDDGTVLASCPSDNPYPTAFVRYDKYYISLDQILNQVYGINPMSYGIDVTGTFQALSADGLTAAMTTYDNCYIIRMPEPFAVAATKVDLLANYTVSIPAGTSMSQISEIAFTFDRAINCKNLPSTVKLLKSDGSTVRSATSTVVSASNDKQFVVTFRTQTLQPGETYTVSIPAQYINIKGDADRKSKEIKVKYVGRSAGPIKAQSINPAHGSTVASFDPTSEVLQIRFDTNVKISDKASCKLYAEGDASPLTTFAAVAEGNTAIFFPTTAYALYAGSDYRLEIAAGSVTDLSGSGGNEAITLSYKGAYRRQISDSDIYLFKDDCEDYSNFIYYEGDHNAPGAIAEGWLFTADTPWCLVRDDEESSDQAMAAHSMFATPGTSDDWLVIPQTFIPDANTYLSFDAQSYLRTKSDRLRVYVYASDAIHNYLTDAVVDDIRANGHLIIDELLSPGVSESLLAGDWTHYTYPLDEYAGKNIYVAFVNNNTNQSAIFLDNIHIARNLDFLMVPMSPTTVVAADDIKVKGILTVSSEIKTFKGIELSLTDAKGNLVDRISDPTAVLGYQDTYPFEFANPLPLVAGEDNRYQITVTSGEDTSTFGYAVKNLIFQAVHKVVLEEYTGSECGNCPLGIRSIETLESLYPDNFLAVALRTYMGDYFGEGVTGYSEFLGIEGMGAPSGRINRGAGIRPAVSTPDGVKFFGRGFVEEDGSEMRLWGDALADELANPAVAAVDFSVDYNETTGSLTVPCKVRFAVNATGQPVRLFAVVVEDGIDTYQCNNYYQVTDPALGEWGQGGRYAQMLVPSVLFNDVARFVVTGSQYNGELMAVTDFTAGKEYSHTLTANVPLGRLDNPANARVVVMLIDGSNGRVINANTAAFGKSGVESVVGLSDDISIVANTDGKVIVSSTEDVSAEVYTLQGVKIARAAGSSTIQLDLNGYRGVVIVSAATASGSKVARLSIK